MDKFQRYPDRPGLLVSVRNAAESLSALAGGADVIDVKEPSRGSLGPADTAEMARVVLAIRGRRLVTAAGGELLELLNGREASRATIQRPPSMPIGVALWKLGLSGCARLVDWPDRWGEAVAQIASGARPVGVVYADWRDAGAPAPPVVVAAAMALRCPALLIDTWDKSSGTLLDHWPTPSLGEFIAEIQAQGMAVVLAGRLSGRSFREAAGLRPDLVAVRGAACEGGRSGMVSSARVAELVRELADHR